ncbi:MAG: WD40 repeat domain-containing protein [Pirellulaceae bacterium]
MLAFSQDGSKIAAVKPNAPSFIQICDSVTGEVLSEFQAVDALSSFCDFGGPDQSLLVCVTRDRHIRVWDTNQGKEIAAIHEPSRTALSPIAISPDGKLLAWRRDDGAVELREFARESSRVRW